MKVLHFGISNVYTLPQRMQQNGLLPSIMLILSMFLFFKLPNSQDGCCPTSLRFALYKKKMNYFLSYQSESRGSESRVSVLTDEW